ncbi:MAG: hypothetical protein JXA42_13440 [Anaerolineales bacterium]|nr:hypothetical protein [Anaerolineales bacterium]
MRFQEYDVVCVTRLLTPSRRIDGTDGVMRQPQVGDVGTVVAVWHNAGTGPIYMVECVNEEGLTTWLCDFDIEELELQTQSAQNGAHE